MNDENKNNLIITYDKYARDRYQAKNVEWKLAEREKFKNLIDNKDIRLILDLGAGPARDAPYFRGNGYDIICVDISREMIKICSENGLPSVVMDIDNIGFAENSFDAVWAMNSLLHIPKNKIDTVLRDIKRVLKPGGYIYIGMFGGHNFEGISENDFYTPKRFFSFYSDDDLKAAVSSHFEIIDFTRIPLETRQVDFQSLAARNGGI